MLIAITGPAGSGKTTTANLLVKKLENGVSIDMDTVKHFICTGFHYDQTDAGKKQWELLGQNISDLLTNFLKQGYNVVINGYVDKATWSEITKKHTIDHKWLLLPTEEVNVARDSQRPGNIPMGKEDVLIHRTHFQNSDEFDEWDKFDCSDMKVSESIEFFYKKLAE